MIRFTKLVRPAALIAGMTVCLAPAMCAQTDADLFASQDKNGDGVLTIEDAAHLEVAIFMLDKDKSGGITQAEFKPFSEYGTLTVEDPFFFTPSEGEKVSSEPYDSPNPKILSFSVMTVDLTQPGKVRYAMRQDSLPEDHLEGVTVEFAPPETGDITFG